MIPKLISDKNVFNNSIVKLFWKSLYYYLNNFVQTKIIKDEITHEYIQDQNKKINIKIEEMNKEHTKFIREQNEKERK